MGQYQQWLYHREVDQQLRVQLARLEQKRQILQEQAAQLADDPSWIDNPIIQAIAMQQSSAALLIDTPNYFSKPGLSSPIAQSSGTQEIEQSVETVSPALFAWGNLPNLDTQDIPLQTADASTNEYEKITSAKQSAGGTLLPEDMAAFIDTHTHITSPIRVPHRPGRALLATTPIYKVKVTPAPDDRTDYSIQRWLERWGRQSSAYPIYPRTTGQHVSREDNMR